MKKLNLLGCFLCVMLLGFGVATSVQAVPIFTGNAPPVVAPFWIGSAGGTGGNNVSNYDSDLLNEIIVNWNSSYDPDFDLLTPDVPYDYEMETSNPTIAWEGNYQYLTAKYGGYIDLFYVDGISGLDWVYKIENHGLSHYRLWNPTSTSVPEPATMLLLGTGLIGLAGVGRKKFFRG